MFLNFVNIKLFQYCYSINFGFRFLFICFIILTFVHCERNNQESTVKNNNRCTYFGKTRYSSPESNLADCTWYANDACCKRTEVTSVFSSLEPLDGASKDCVNRMNYFMCYFCSPHQYKWYGDNGIIRVCSDFCDEIYTHCHSARYRGERLGAVYQSGAHFCKHQNFDVVPSSPHCFSFDPTVFGHGMRYTGSFFGIMPLLLMISTIKALLL